MTPPASCLILRRRFPVFSLSTSLSTLSFFPQFHQICTNMLNSKNLPRWLDGMLSEKFFNACIIHEESKKNEKNIFCLDCCEGICPHCLSAHQSHRLLQIRRYVYKDVLRVRDAQKLIDCSHVQSYTNNSAKVMFLKQRPQTRSRGSTSTCSSCDRALQNPNLYCSLSCKLLHILRTEGRLTKDHIFEIEGVSFPEPGFDDDLITPDPVLEPTGSYRTESGSSGVGYVLACTATTEPVVRKKRSSGPQYRAACQPVVLPVAELSGGRRKSVPHRSPLY